MNRAIWILLAILAFCLAMVWQCTGFFGFSHSESHSSTTTTTTTTTTPGGSITQMESHTESSDIAVGTEVIAANRNRAIEQEFTQIIVLGRENPPAWIPDRTCMAAMNATDFQVAKRLIEKEFMEEDKLMAAKLILQERCVTTAQVVEIIDAFFRSENKLAFAKFAYGHTTDRFNYLEVKDKISFPADKRELEEYMRTIDSM